MKLKQSTLVLLFVALFFAGGVYVYESQREQREEIQAQQKRMFEFEVEQVASMTVETEEQTLTFDRLEPESDSTPTQPRWTMAVVESSQTAETQTDETATEDPATEETTETAENGEESASEAPTEGEGETAATETSPETGEESESDSAPANESATDGEEEPTATDSPDSSSDNGEDSATEEDGETATTPSESSDPVMANEAYVSFLLNLMISEQHEEQFTIAPEDKDRYGLEEPSATVEVVLTDGTSHRLILGDRDSLDRYLYAIADPPSEDAEEITVLAVSTNFENGVDRPLSEWKAEEEEETESDEVETETPSESPPTGE